MRGFIGRFEEGNLIPHTHHTYLYTHYHFNFEYNQNRVIIFQFEVIFRINIMKNLFT